MKRLLTPLIAAVIGALLFSGLLLLDFYKTIDSRMYDLMLRIKPAIVEEDNILLLEVDDLTIAEANRYPIPRDVYADGLILMKEFNPAWTMVDIEFVDFSTDAVDENYLNQGVVDDITSTFEYLNQNQRDLIDSILSGRISRGNADDALGDLEQSNWDTANNLYEDLSKVTISRDEILAEAMAYVSDISATVNMTNEKDPFEADSEPGKIKAEAREYARRFAIPPEKLIFNIPVGEVPFGQADWSQPSIIPVLEASSWAGYPRMHIDPDGVRRRVDVLYGNNGDYYTHMGFGTWWVRQGMPTITVDKDALGRIFIHVGDYDIPLDSEGKMLINWPKRLYDGTPLNRKAAESFDADNPDHRLSFFFLLYHEDLVTLLSRGIADLEYYGVYSDTYGTTTQPLSAFEADLDAMKESMLSSRDGSRAGEYGEYRDQFLLEALDFFSGDAENKALSALQEALSIEGLTDDDYSFYVEAYQAIPAIFAECRGLAEDLIYFRDEVLRPKVSGATIVLGYTGTSTSDYGANPFERRYMNMGIYGAVYNSLEQGEFLEELPFLAIVVIAVISGILIGVFSNISRKNSQLNTILGAALVLLLIAAAGAAFVLWDLYVNLLPLILTLLTTYLASIVRGFLIESRNKAQIQSAFNQVISPDLVRQIQENPELMEQRGKNLVITAMFTDIEAFSTISEHLGSPDKIIDMLERYLTPLSDIILDEGGTIDKYEGDAIIAFWNAPIDQEDHVHRACRAAMRMLEMEKEIYKDLVKEGIWSEELKEKLRARGNPKDIHQPHDYLFTRIGINTGVNNVGFVGTAARKDRDGRKDYTALGDGMNLAARLEGVNKQYGTQVLVSGSTEEVVHNHFITRRLDRIRVVGKEDVIPLYELSYFKKFPEHYYPEEHDDFRDYYKDIEQSHYNNAFNADERQCFNFYRDAQDLFQKKDWKGALTLFNKILEQIPNDGPSLTFRQRCENYIKKAPRKDWDGVYRMEFK